MTAENLTNLPQKNDELTDDQLEKVAGGRKAGGKPVEYLQIKMADLVVTSIG